MNKVIITGRLTADPELRQTQSGVSSCRFTIATDRKFKNKATGKKEADFISCVAFRQTADFIGKYFTKGKMIAVEGSLRTGSYQDRNHPDVKHYTTDVLVDNVEFCGDKGNTTHQQATPADNNYGDLSDFEEILSDGDTPF